MKVANKTRKNIMTMGVALALSIVITFIIAGYDGEWRNIGLNVLYGLLIGLSLGLGSLAISTYFFGRAQWTERPTRIFNIVLVVVTGFIIVDILLLNSLWFYFTQNVDPISLLKNSFGRNILLVEFVVGMSIFLFFIAKNYAEHLNENYAAMALIEKQAERYRFETLKNQINPHFLFNTLNTLSGLIYIDIEKSDEFIQRFASIYRYVLHVQQKDVVPLNVELGFIADYIYLNNIRFDGQIKMIVEIVDQEQFVLPMALQLLIENTIKHNVVGPNHPLQIRIYETDSALHVENNFAPKKDKVPSHQLGIENLRQRYNTLSDIQIQCVETADLFTVILPKLQKATP